jgi:spermidine synthase
MARIVLYVVFALGGVSAVIYEVIWARNFRLVFGSSARAAAAVLAAYFLGLTLGYLVGAHLRRRGKCIRTYGLTEIAIGLTALLVPVWLSLFAHHYPTLFQLAAGSPWFLATSRLVLAFVALAPPTIGMGITLPLVTQAMVTRTDHVARRTGLIYALNILGAVAGALLAGIFLPIWIGIQNSIWLAAGMNMAIGLAALLIAGALDVRVPAAEEVFAQGETRAARGRPSRGLVALAAASGFGVLALEVLYVRILSQQTEGSVYSFSLMLAIVLFFLALGALVVARWLDRTDPWRLLSWTQLVAAACIPATPLLVELVKVLIESPLSVPIAVRLVLYGLGVAAVLGPPVTLIGVVLPATWKIATESPSMVGGQVGVLSAVNTLAGVGGALAAGFLLLPSVGLTGSILIVAAIYAALAMTGFWLGHRGPVRWVGLAACPLAIVGWYFLGAANRNLHPLPRGTKLISYHDGEGATVAVAERGDGQRMLWMNHRYLLGSSTALASELGQGRLPLALHASPERVALVGVATGITASAVLDFPPVKRVVAMEIIPGVADAAAYFNSWNRSVFADPRVEMVVADGRNHLLGTRETFDVIISDLFVPWHAGTGDLYTVEHFRICRERLAPGGIFAQWLPGWQLSAEELRVVTASLLEVFPAVTLWRNDFSTGQPVLALIAYRDNARIDAGAVSRVCQRLGNIEGPRAAFLGNVLGLHMLYVCGDAQLRDWADGAPLNTDDRPTIEYSAPRSRYRQGRPRGPLMFEFLGQFRPRRWSYDERILDEPSLSRALEAADRMHDAQVAMLKNNFVEEFAHLEHLIELAGDVPAVAEHIVSVSARYRSRRMTDRSDKLLSALAERPDPPISALLALADARRLDGQHQQAIALLERAAHSAPDRLPIHRELVDLLTGAKQFTEAQAHLERLVASAPDDPFLRLELAHNFDQQGKSSEASHEVDEFRRRWNGENRQGVWRYLRSLELGKYVDQSATDAK